ncbi:MAG TPA: beta-propeller fold lactonase family protein [Gaiellaceae bacterium]|nr:beta-propeller fold lactonase family protein [Gaiellaceae bacterium]
MILAGGLTAADVSTGAVELVRADGVVTPLPQELHDSTAAALGKAVYLFGGGNGIAQLDAIVRIAPGSHVTVGRLPAPSSDQAGAAVGQAEYIVGGYTGTRWLDTIVRWQPGHPSVVVGHLPTPLRYAAVAAVDGKVVIAGGSKPDGTASARVLSFDPVTRHVSSVGLLPAPTTHAAAAGLGRFVYVIGGRGALVGTPTAAVEAVDPAHHKVVPAGTLDAPLSDLAAVGLPGRILLAGGRGAHGTVSTISSLVPTRTRTMAAPKSLRPDNVYAADTPTNLTGPARHALPRVYVPNSQSNTVSVIDPATYKVVERFSVGTLPQHVVPAYNLAHLYVTNDVGNTLTEIDPETAKPVRTYPVDDPYNMYFTPDGQYAIVVAERNQRLDFRNSHTFALVHSVATPCRGVDHMDFTADGSKALVSCEFSGQMLVLDVNHQRVVKTFPLDHGRGMPQDVKLSPDGRLFYVADMNANGVWTVNAHTFRLAGFIHTGGGAHGLYPSRDDRYLYVSNRQAGSVSVVDFATRKVAETWRIPGGSPDMGGVSADGNVLWLSGRYNSEVYAISTRDGKLLARIPVGAGPHGLCVWPQPGRYSLGHTGILR